MTDQLQSRWLLISAQGTLDLGGRGKVFPSSPKKFNVFQICFKALNTALNKLGERGAFIALIGTAILGIVIFYFVGIYNCAFILIYGASVALSNSAFWTLWTALFLALAVVLIIFHPMTKAKFKAIEKALEDRRSGRQPDTAGFQDLL